MSNILYKKKGISKNIFLIKYILGENIK